MSEERTRKLNSDWTPLGRTYGMKEESEAVSRGHRGEGTRPRTRRPSSGRKDCCREKEETGKAQTYAREAYQGGIEPEMRPESMSWKWLQPNLIGTRRCYYSRPIQWLIQQQLTRHRFCK